jgi:hypothetical protein
LVELACGNCNRLVETPPQRRPHRAARRFDRIVALMTFEEFPHVLRFTHSFKHLLGQKSAVYKPQGFAVTRSFAF